MGSRLKRGKLKLLCFRLQYTGQGASQLALVVKNLLANVGDIGDTGSIPRLRRSPGGGYGNPLQYSCLENPMDRGTWRTAVPVVVKGQT